MPEPTPANPLPTQTQKTPSEWFDTVMRALTPLLLAYIATVGTPEKPPAPAPAPPPVVVPVEPPNSEVLKVLGTKLDSIEKTLEALKPPAPPKR